VQTSVTSRSDVLQSVLSLALWMTGFSSGSGSSDMQAATTTNKTASVRRIPNVFATDAPLVATVVSPGWPTRVYVERADRLEKLRSGPLYWGVRWVLVLALTGCSFNPGQLAGDGDGGVDPTGDGGSAGDDASPTPLVVSHVDPADADPGTDALALTANATIDTNARTISGVTLPAGVTFEHVAQPGGPEVAVLRVGSLDIAAAAQIRVTGSRPLVVIAATAINVKGTLDAGARRAVPGAGGGPHDQPHTGRGVAGANDGGAGGSGGVGDSGGSGGGFGTVGGGGGGGGGPISDPKITIAGPAGGAAHGTPELAVLRGGGAGGVGSPCMTEPGGSGGGAIQLSAFETITVDGVIHVGGGGGGRGYRCPSTGGSGGGGGAGGAIFLEANAITLGGTLAANGGGGGSGADSPNSLDGIFGADAEAAASAAPGAAQVNGGIGGAGGAGGWRDADAVKGADTGYANGGGGGGAVGRIVVRSHLTTTPSGIASPTAVFLTY